MPDKESSASKISFEDFTTATLNAIVRTMEVHAGSSNPLIRNPHILLGIVWTPELPGELQGVAAKKFER
jgi:hypothetical protein